MFGLHLAYLRFAGWRCVTLDEVARALADEETLPSRSFALTFDDAYIGIYRHAFPILRRFGCRATVFVPSQLIGQRAGAGETEPVTKVTSDELRRMIDAGVSIGAHSRTHADLPALTDCDLEDEVTGSKVDLERLLGTAVTTFCYPFGHFDARVVAAVRRAGYGLACTVEHGNVYRDDDPLVLPRISVGNNLSPVHLAYRVERQMRAPVGVSA
jgi:peptidoglycan/xylan/chitin deacetylase (PgdA/CDA1 family)